VNQAIQSMSITIDDHTQVGDARRRGINIANQLQFDETESGKVGIVITEAAKNIVKHAGNGQIIIRTLQQNNMMGIEILALDKGPGMDLRRCLEDGYSTAGSPGTGMGAMSRLSSAFDVYSVDKKGTAVVAQLWSTPAKAAKDNDVGGICVPVAGESDCGDAWAFHRYGNRVSIIAVDGLGHGPMAAMAANAAIHAFQTNPERAPADMLRMVHGALLSTRGAAVATAVIDMDARQLHFAGVGNISGILFDGDKIRGLPSFNGTVGHQLHKVQEIIYPWPERAWLVMHSDGLYNRWKMDDYPGLLRHHPSIIAGMLYRDFQRGRDDSMAVVFKENR